ncbi:uncharacterized protein PGTG_11424 [Puccinia graminis f. sp. tritici CRL 75-36-700-3]|uniref:Uncharacterized protein n=1 Tax=Puccinia graminis f. sp. tritici (strain CRL 75-36-700-3 / race SCCL) TaxID=418459 RepID=E3KLQ6_PUCGT|nr:uncharacterized protein PGTG_11424 [Puccinia graminis f. sp. tritici CRL 75-36-700-3]EFP85255.1 hypothetical protein PGTG_11424 [Puccinia graminis f. sp. tritici CRL 75-36-700-3]
MPKQIGMWEHTPICRKSTLLQIGVLSHRTICFGMQFHVPICFGMWFHIPIYFGMQFQTPILRGVWERNTGVACDPPCIQSRYRVFKLEDWIGIEAENCKKVTRMATPVGHLFQVWVAKCGIATQFSDPRGDALRGCTACQFLCIF